MFLQILYFAILFRYTIGECNEDFDKERIRSPHYVYHNGYRNYEEYDDRVHKATIVCTDLISSAQIASFHTYVEQSYDQFLKISNSSISTWEPSELSSFVTITKLYMTGNYIKTILPGAFNGLTRLRELYVNNNELREMSNGVFNSLHRLEILDLSNNQISQIDSYALLGLSSLKTLHLEQNKITKLEASVLRSVRYLQYMNVSVNPLQTIAIEKTLSNIDNLIITNTPLSDFSENLSNLTVKTLNLSANDLTAIDFSVFPKANSIDLSNNVIDFVENCEYLDAISINFNHNNIHDFNCTIHDASVINIQHNKISVFQSNIFQNCKSVIKLRLDHNFILQLDKNIFQNLKSLEVLNLQNNEISEVNPSLFRDLFQLKFLNLSHNKIEQFQYGIFDSLKKLTVLDISHNKLKDLHQYTFSSLSNLVDLHFDNNEISSFDATDLTDHLPNLGSVFLDYNPWTCKDLVKIFKFFKSKKISIDEGENYNDENFHGIQCYNEDQVQPTNTSNAINNLIEDIESTLGQRLKTYFVKPIKTSSLNLKNFTQDLQKSVREALENSTLQRFFNEDFANSKFFQYFNRDYSRTKFFKFFNNFEFGLSKENVNKSTAEKLTSVEIKPNIGDNPVMVFSAIMLVVMLCFMAAMVFLLLKLVNKNETKRIQSESEMELS